MRYIRSFIIGAFALGLSACTGGGSGGSSTIANPPVNTNPPTTYGTFALVTPTGIPSTGWSFDISFVDPTQHEYYLADRSNAGIDVISLVNDTFLGTAGAHGFVGKVPAGSDFSGPNGVASIGNGNLVAGDGNSTIKIVNINSMSVVATINAVNPYTGATLTALAANQCAATSGVPTTGAANGRSDELAYDPVDSEALIIDDAACPAFGTFISTNPPFAVLGSIAFTTATAGAEQPNYDPTQHKFLENIPSTIANPGGEVDVIDPKAFTVTNVFPEPSNCQAAGGALGANEALFLGCGNASGPMIVINAATGATLATIAGSGGCDETWYNPNANRFYGACSNYTGGPNMIVVNASTYAVDQIFPTSTGAHSVAVDPYTDKIFGPQSAGTNIGVGIWGH